MKLLLDKVAQFAMLTSVVVSTMAVPWPNGNKSDSVSSETMKRERDKRSSGAKLFVITTYVKSYDY